jgi:hypothetical protein
LIRGADLAPPGGNSNGTGGISTERIPKSAARVLDAARIRAEYRKKRAWLQNEGADAKDVHTSGAISKPPPPKKRRTDAGAGTGAEKSRAKGKGHPVDTIEIKPGESLKHFNRYRLFF